MRARELAIAEQLVAVGARAAEAHAYAREMSQVGTRLAPIDLRSFERERAGWLARRRDGAPGVRYVNRTGQGIAGEPVPIRPIASPAMRGQSPGPAPDTGAREPVTPDGRAASLSPPATLTAALRRRLEGAG
jgi:hypothetical protein